MAQRSGYLEEYKEIDIDLLEKTVNFLADKDLNNQLPDELNVKYFNDFDVKNKIMSFSARDGFKTLEQDPSLEVHKYLF